MELLQIKEAISFYQKKVKKQGLIINARDSEHLENLKKLYKELKEQQNEL
mgnify:CR=1 FL=1|tara:strand:- start:712 stop:861 length:150 start_codon:yes stop_codon:yes gene_type:complete